MSLWNFLTDVAIIMNQRFLDEWDDDVLRGNEEQCAQDALECCANCRYLGMDDGASCATCYHDCYQVRGRWGIEHMTLTSSPTETKNFIYTHKCRFFERK